jgi:GNAT superfamily N-acetyltransferase
VTNDIYPSRKFQVPIQPRARVETVQERCRKARRAPLPTGQRINRCEDVAAREAGEHRRQGVGRALMDAVRSAAKDELPPSRNRHRLPLPSVFERQFDSAGHCNTLFPRQCSPMAISLSTITGTQLIAAFARFSGIRVKVSAAIHAVCFRVRGRLTLCLCGIRNDRNYTYRKASNQAHGNLPRALGRRAILSKDRRLARLSRDYLAGIPRMACRPGG